MAYAPQTWTNGSGGNTPLSAARLNVLEQGLSAAAGVADTASSAATAAGTSTTPRPALVNDRGAWAASTAYAVGDLVTRNARRYLAPTAFTSGTTFSSANWVDMGPLTITVNGSGPSSAGDFTVSGSGTSVSLHASRLVQGSAYSTPFIVGVSNGTPAAGSMYLARMISGRAFTAGSLFTASFYINAATASGFIRPVLYKLNPDTLALTLLADFGQVDVSTGAATVKSVTGVASLADIAVNDMLAVGAVAQGVQSAVQCVSGFDPYLPGTPTNSVRPAGLLVAGVTGTPPSTPTATVYQSSTAAVPLVYLTAQS